MSNLLDKALSAKKLRALSAVGVVLLISSASPCLAKRGSFLMPSYEKLDDGASPATNDVTAGAVKAANLPQSLAPINLGGNNVTSGSASEENGVLKMNVSATGFAPKGPLDSGNLFKSKSLTSDKKDSLLNHAIDTGVMPLPLLESMDETEKKVDTVLSSEQAQMRDLWESTLSRSPDIQFVVQKLMPSSNPGHARTVMMRMLSTALCTAMNAGAMIAPSPMMYAGSGGAQNV